VSVIEVGDKRPKRLHAASFLHFVFVLPILTDVRKMNKHYLFPTGRGCGTRKLIIFHLPDGRPDRAVGAEVSGGSAKIFHVSFMLM
jgi:hypothetical protein